MCQSFEVIYEVSLQSRYFVDRAKQRDLTVAGGCCPSERHHSGSRYVKWVRLHIRLSLKVSSSEIPDSLFSCGPH